MENSSNTVTLSVNDFSIYIRSIQKLDDIRKMVEGNIDLMDDTTRASFVLRCIGSVVDVVPPEEDD